MDFSVQKYISNFIENQFPQFYKEEGPNFITFVKAYYEWMEETGNPIREARSIYDYRDIDNTIENFLEYFQKKYLYGIPFNVIINKRLLLKHILDVYRSKGSTQGLKLLFRLIYDEDMEIYLPGEDIIKASDGTWVQKLYLEVTANPLLNELVGKTVIGASSKVSATVESYVKETFNRHISNVLYISNISPKGKDFTVGERLVAYDQISNTQAVITAPTILGSLSEIEIISGGQGFKIGDIIKIAYKDPTTNETISYGDGGLLNVTGLKRGLGEINFNLKTPGFGYMANAETLVYRKDTDTTGQGADFDIFSLVDVKNITYNTDLIYLYNDISLNSVSFGFPANTSANLSSNIGQAFSFTNNFFGAIASLINIKTGNSYTDSVDTYIRTVQTSNALPGNIVYNTTSNTVTGTSTVFDQVYANGDSVYLQANSFLDSTYELQIIKQVVSNTQLILKGPPSYNSTASALYKMAPNLLGSEFALSDPIMFREDGTVNGLNANVIGIPSVGNNVVKEAISVDSGQSYVDGEEIDAYLYNGVTTPIALEGGTGYSNGDSLIVSLGGVTSEAIGFVTTDSNGSVISTTLTYSGSGYNQVPVVRIKSANGVGAILETSILKYNTYSVVKGKVRKKALGKGKGYWSTTRGLLNSDKYIQDSYYYQDYSYEVQSALTLEKYKDVLYKAFHSSGSELFGKFLLKILESSTISILYETTTANTSVLNYAGCDRDDLTSDSNTIIVSNYIIV